MNVTVVVGNPKPASRTLDAGVRLTERITGSAPTSVIDVIDLGPDLLGWAAPPVLRAIETVRGSDLIIVASPTFKATYTGLLKLFLDQIPADGLQGVTAVPLMLGAGPAHLLAPELLLKPVLVELGATCPAQGLYQMDRTYQDDPYLDAWLNRWRPSLLRHLTEMI